MNKFILPQCTFSEVTSKHLLKSIRIYARNMDLPFKECQDILSLLYFEEGLRVWVAEEDPIALRCETVLFPKVATREVWLAFKSKERYCFWCRSRVAEEVVKLFLLVPDDTGIYLTYFKKGE